MPASAAPVPSCTESTTAPRLASRPNSSATSGVTSIPAIPSSGWRTNPSSMSWSAEAIACSADTANPTPWLAPLRVRMAVLMPTRRPRASTSAPPELPGLIAASVWITDGITSRPPSSASSTAISRLSALMMPVVTDASSPNGEPIATTVSPTISGSSAPGG
jgi:hypothetical protein